VCCREPGSRRFLFVRRPVHRPVRAPRRSRPAPDDHEKLTFPWRRIVTIVVIVGLLAAALHRQIDVEAIHAFAADIHGGAAFALLTLLPLVGFPASILHVAAGIRFGAGLGLALVGASILLQLLASYGLVHAFRSAFARTEWIRRVRRRIPRGAHASLCVFAVMLPGAPYAAINYTLPLVGVPFWTYLLCCLPLHTLRATVTVFLGDQSDKLTGARLGALGVYALLILGASWWTFLRLRTQLGDPPAAGDGRTQPA
jgi:uncharacterized membrane protein YdjX (TVP38/TMEM64 family)